LNSFYYNTLEKLLNNTIRPRYMLKKNKSNDGNWNIINKEFDGLSKSFHEYQLMELIRDVKESTCEITEDGYNEQNMLNAIPKTYEFPDNSTIELKSERFSLPECLFNNKFFPENNILQQEDIISIPEMICKTIKDITEIEVIRECNNIILSGGNTLFNNFSKRLIKELSNNPQIKFQPNIIASPSSIERTFCPWIGGSILSSLGTFHKMWMSNSEYGEHGKTLVDMKCP